LLGLRAGEVAGLTLDDPADHNIVLRGRTVLREEQLNKALRPILRVQLSQLLRAVIESGKGIELNTSGYRRWLGEPIPAPYILSMYRELGGEIITVGSDAHRPEEAGADVRRCLILLKELGYNYYCAFSKRKPKFIKLEL
jgi:histidinol phosphatase-like PHP family hydrolase